MNFINESNYCRKNSPKRTQMLWKCLESMGFESNRKTFEEKLLNQSISEFKTNDDLKAVIKQSLEERLIAEDVDSNRRFRLIALKDKKQFFGQTNDWYCFECHSCYPNRPLIGCKSCFRSIHSLCSGNDSNAEDMDYKDLRCVYCRRQLKTSNANCGTRLDQLCGEELKRVIKMFYTKLENTFVCNWNKKVVKFDINVEYSLEPNADTDVLLFSFMNLTTIRLKVFDFENYSSISELESDLKHFCHNYSIVNNEETIKPFVENIDFELNELKRCLDCYRRSRALGSHALSPNEWFTLVCNPPHRLVYAKHKSWCFWPSKVIEESADSDKVFVQFFYPKLFTIAEIPKDKIRDIEYKFESKQLTSDQMYASMALLFKYLTNLKAFDNNFIYNELLKRLEYLLRIKWNKLDKRKISELKKLNIDFTDNKCTNDENSNKRRLEESDNNSGLESVYQKFLENFGPNENLAKKTKSIGKKKRDESSRTQTTSVSKHLSSDESQDESYTDRIEENISNFYKSDEFPDQMKFEMFSRILKQQLETLRTNK